MTNSIDNVTNGTVVSTAKGNLTVTGYAAGWFSGDSEDGKTVKFRAKSIIKVLTEAEDDEEDEEVGGMSSHINKYRKGYKAVTSYTGRSSLNNADEVANMLAGLEPTEVMAIAERVLGLKKNELSRRYAHLNLGSCRMNAGNLIRSSIKREEITADDVAKAVIK